MSAKTLKQWLQNAKSQLETVSPSPGLDAELLLCHSLDSTRAYLFAHGNDEIEAAQLEIADQLLKRRIQGEPLAYITGQQEFWSMSLQVNSHTLIPRPDTERLVELVLATEQRTNCNVLDLGTGSGAIALALAKEQPNWKITATDQSAAALEIAKHNSQNHNLSNITFIESDWFCALKDQKFDLIVSNPPYIDAADPHLSALSFEPSTALIANDNGLSDLKQIINQASHFLNNSGWLFVEHGYQQGASCRELFHKAGFKAIETARDLGPNERVSYGKQ